MSTVINRGPAGSPDDQAAYWFALLRSEHLTAADERAFDQWRQAASHAQAYERQVRAWETLDMAALDPEILALRRAALRAAPRNGLRWFAAVAGGASLAAVLATVLVTGNFLQRLPGLGGAFQADRAMAFETAIGERSTATLPDGSLVELNTDTRMEAQLTADRRVVHMDRGQAVFQVAKDAHRPFVVIAGDRRIIALGTQFEVRVDSHDVAVTLLEGRVAVEEARTPEEEAAPRPSRSAIELQPGQQFVSSSGAGASIRTANLDRVAGWRQGRLDFGDETLAEVVKEINRYSMRKVVIEDPSLATLRISGSFLSGSVDNFATALVSLYPVIQQRSGEESIGLSWSARAD